MQKHLSSFLRWLLCCIVSILAIQQVSAQCAAPSSLSVSSIKHDGAKITWALPVGGATAYSWFLYSSQGNVVQAGTGQLTQATILGLAASTTYAVAVRTICLGGSLSNPLGPITFTTACAPELTPYTQNFNAVAVNALPACWTALNMDTTAATWVTSNETNKGLKLTKYVMNSWVFTQGMSLEAGISYNISFDYQGNNSVGGTLTLYEGVTPAPMDMNVAAITTINLTTQSANSLNVFTPTTTGVYYLGWKATRNNNASTMTMRIDNIKIEPQGCVNAPIINSITGVTANTATANWTNIIGASGYEWKVVLQGAGSGAQAVASGVVGAGVTTVTATSLPAGDHYDFYIRSKCGTQNTSAWSNFASFQCIAQAELGVSPANDAYIEVNWALPVAPCLLNGSGQPYSQGVHLSLNDATNNQEVFATNIGDLSSYVGDMQPVFTSVVNGVNGSMYEITNTVNAVKVNGGADIPYWTLETWLLHNSSLNNALLFTNKQNGVNQVRIKFVNAQQVQLLVGSNVYNFPVGYPAYIPAGKWVHIAFASTGSKVKLYVNGEFINEQSINSGDISFLKLKNTGSDSYPLFENYANGQIGEVRLWKRLRSATEIKNDRFLTSISTVAKMICCFG